MEIQNVKAQQDIAPIVEKAKAKFVKTKEINPDTFEKLNSIKQSAAIVGVTTVGAALKGPSFIEKVANGVAGKTDEWVVFIKKIGSEFAENKLKAGLKWGLTGTIGAVALAFILKDSDGDKKLDIIESIGKLINPTE